MVTENLRRRMERLIQEVLHKDGLSFEEMLNAILMAREVLRLPDSPTQIDEIRRRLKDCVESRLERHRTH